MYLRFGDRGSKVVDIQIALGDVIPDGVFGRMTESSVKNFQKKKGWHPDGVVSPEMMELLLDEDLTTDMQDRHSKIGDLLIDRHYLPLDEYVSGETTNKKYLFLHHTAGNHNPYATIDMWARDNRGRIGTQYVIGGKALNGSSTYDGVVVEAFPGKNWAYHLGRVDKYMHSHSIGIEICNYGYLTENKGVFRTWSKNKVPDDQVFKLKRHFRGYEHYHSYTLKQIEALAKLIPFIAEKHDIDISKGIYEWLQDLEFHEALEYYPEAIAGRVKGLLSHTNVRKDKTDIYPHPSIEHIIRSLNKKGEP